MILILVAGLATWAVWQGKNVSPSASNGDAVPTTNGSVPSASSPAASPATPSADPFAGTPAEHFADGAAGIVLPRPHALAGYSRAQVMAAYRTVKSLLVAANLNWHTLRGGSPRAFAGLLVRQERLRFINGLSKTGVTRRGYDRSTRGWVTSFAPGTTQFVGDVIKAHGHMAARTADSNGWHVLRVRADYLFVYAVERPGQPSTRMRVVVRDVLRIDFARWDDAGGPLEPWWNNVGGGIAGGRCDAHDGFVHPEFRNGPPDRVQPSGTPVDPYSTSAPPPKGVCWASTGT